MVSLLEACFCLIKSNLLLVQKHGYAYPCFIKYLIYLLYMSNRSDWKYDLSLLSVGPSSNSRLIVLKIEIKYALY